MATLKTCALALVLLLQGCAATMCFSGRGGLSGGEAEHPDAVTQTCNARVD